MKVLKKEMLKKASRWKERGRRHLHEPKSIAISIMAPSTQFFITWKGTKFFTGFPVKFFPPN